MSRGIKRNSEINESFRGQHFQLNLMNHMDLKRITWQTVKWRRAQRVVTKLQRKIFQAALENNKLKLHKYQQRLLDSDSAKLISVRKVTQDNRGKKTAGIDGVKLLKPEERLKLAKLVRIDGKASPIRRVYIPKPGTDEKRPLGIPTVRDRAKQALAKMALEPEWEAKFEPNSYGFRPGLCPAKAGSKFPRCY